MRGPQTGPPLSPRIVAAALTTAVALLVWAATPLTAQDPDDAPPFPDQPDISQCDNCDAFPEEWLTADEGELLDLASLAPERRLDFLIGEWELLFPIDDPDQGMRYEPDEPVGFEIVDWFVPNKILQAFQEWPFANGGGLPFRAKTDFRYDSQAGRWQMTWLTVGSSGVFVGGLEAGGIIALYEHEFEGSRRAVTLRPGMSYVLRNVTRDHFIAEEYRTADGGKTYPILKWRLRYRRRG